MHHDVEPLLGMIFGDHSIGHGPPAGRCSVVLCTVIGCQFLIGEPQVVWWLCWSGTTRYGCIGCHGCPCCGFARPSHTVHATPVMHYIRWQLWPCVQVAHWLCCADASSCACIVGAVGFPLLTTRAPQCTLQYGCCWVDATLVDASLVTVGHVPGWHDPSTV